MEQFRQRGYVVLRQLMPGAAIDRLMDRFLALANATAERAFDSPHTPAFARFLNERKDVQSRLYDAVRAPDWLETFSREPALVSAVRELLAGPIALLGKIVFRIDAPLETAQLAVWHQDHFYVRGNLDIVTAWIPLQDTMYLQGCLQVMPGSHALGPLAHGTGVLGKRHMPDGVFDREVRLVEMRRGDVLLFHSCLLHASGLNLSDVTRFSVQARFTPEGAPTDPGMGGVRAP